MPQPPQDALFAVEVPPPPPTAGDLVAAWCSAYTGRRGTQPHPSVVKRVAGICRNIGKECGDIEDWRDAWRAAHAAGLRGQWDVVSVLADEHPPGIRVSSVEGALRSMTATANLGRNRAIG